MWWDPVSLDAQACVVRGWEWYHKYQVSKDREWTIIANRRPLGRAKCPAVVPGHLWKVTPTYLWGCVIFSSCCPQPEYEMERQV